MGKRKINTIKETGFKTPEDYFNNLEDALTRETQLRILMDDSGFKTPDTYFNRVEDQIMERVFEKETPKVISIFKKHQLIYASGIAATIALLITFSIFSPKKDNWNRIDTETVENYLIEENIGSYELADLLLDEDIEEADFMDASLNEDLIEAYLLDNSDVENLFIEQNMN